MPPTPAEGKQVFNTILGTYRSHHTHMHGATVVGQSVNTKHMLPTQCIYLYINWCKLLSNLFNNSHTHQGHELNYSFHYFFFFCYTIYCAQAISYLNVIAVVPTLLHINTAIDLHNISYINDMDRYIVFV